MRVSATGRWVEAKAAARFKSRILCFGPFAGSGSQSQRQTQRAQPASCLPKGRRRKAHSFRMLEVTSLSLACAACSSEDTARSTDWSDPSAKPESRCPVSLPPVAKAGRLARGPVNPPRQKSKFLPSSSARPGTSKINAAMAAKM